MCGLVGAISASPLALEAATATLVHRGPDAEGTWSGRHGDWSIQLGHRRLAVIDLSAAGQQPMWDAAGRVALVYNGEVYNFLALRQELEARGSHFRSQTDSEVILEGYLAWGARVVDRLQGMFAFALWDGRNGQLLLARDRLGIKPLFLAPLNGGVAFASEMKALFALGVKKRLAPRVLDAFLTYLYVPSPETAFQGVEELAPGHRVLFRPGGPLQPERYWRPPTSESAFVERDLDSLAHRLRGCLEQVVERQLVADVPLGAFLSGGLDSSTLVALMAQRRRRPKTFCMVFGSEEHHYDERRFAREVADHFGTEHHEVEVKPTLVDLLPKVVHHFDQPFGNPTALLSYELSRLTRKEVTVALSGDGGDELFLGYPRYAGVRLAGAYRRLPLWLRAGLNSQVAARLPEASDGRHTLRRAREFLSTGVLPPEQMYASWVSYFTAQELRMLLVRPSPQAESEGFLHRLFEASKGDLVDRAAWVDLQSFLPGNVLAYGDRMSMAHGLELRVPLCDEAIVELAARLPARFRMRGLCLKSLLKRAMADLLPEKVLQRGKQGFNPPMGLWLNRELRTLTAEVLSAPRLERAGFFRPEAVQALVAEHASGKRDRSLHIWALLVFQVWFALHFEKDASGLAGVSECLPA
jgi:asparagine synthase (glutamine-hydrolysing)